jgi:hypothetical protein
MIVSVFRMYVSLTATSCIILGALTLLPKYLEAQDKKLLDQIASGSAGTATENVTNLSSVGLTAFHVTYVCTDGQTLNYEFDGLTYNANKVLYQGQSRSVIIPSKYADCKGGVDAALFADGSTQGKSSIIRSLDTRRRSFANELSFLQSSFKGVGNGRADATALNKRLQQRADSIPTEHAYGLDEKTGRIRAIRLLLKRSQELSVQIISKQKSTLNSESTQENSILQWLQERIQAVADTPQIKVN